MEQKQPWPEWGDSAKQAEEHLIPELPPDAPVLDEAARSNILDHTINTYVIHGWRIESRTPVQAILVKGHRPNHILHAILTLATCLLWGIVWIAVAATTKEERTVLTVDEYGRLVRAVSRE